MTHWSTNMDIRPKDRRRMWAVVMAAAIAAVLTAGCVSQESQQAADDAVTEAERRAALLEAANARVAELEADKATLTAQLADADPEKIAALTAAIARLRAEKDAATTDAINAKAELQRALDDGQRANDEVKQDAATQDAVVDGVQRGSGVAGGAFGIPPSVTDGLTGALIAVLLGAGAVKVTQERAKKRDADLQDIADRAGVNAPAPTEPAPSPVTPELVEAIVGVLKAQGVIKEAPNA